MEIQIVITGITSEGNNINEVFDNIDDAIDYLEGIPSDDE